MTPRPALHPSIAEVRRAVRSSLAAFRGTRVVVALSGGPDSLALAAAVAFEAPKLDVDAGAVIVDHALQPASDEIAAAAAATVENLGLRATVVRVEVAPSGDGPEAAARAARYRALRDTAAEQSAAAVLLGHTLDDQAETVLLGLARGSGAASLSGMAPIRADGSLSWVRPLLSVHRRDTVAACQAQGLAPWRDPHNDDPRFARVRVRRRVLPVLESELGPGIADALARTADQLREDAEAFAELIEETIEDLVEPAEAGIAISVAALAANPAALRHRIVRHVAASEFHVSLTRAQTLEVARLATDWRGQGPVDLPGCRAVRQGGRIVIAAAGSS